MYNVLNRTECQIWTQSEHLMSKFLIKKELKWYNSKTQVRRIVQGGCQFFAQMLLKSLALCLQSSVNLNLCYYTTTPTTVSTHDTEPEPRTMHKLFYELGPISWLCLPPISALTITIPPLMCNRRITALALLAQNAQ